MFIKQAIEVLFHGLPAQEVVEKHWIVADGSNVSLYEAREKLGKLEYSCGILSQRVRKHYFTDADKAISLFGNCRIIKNAVKLSDDTFGLIDSSSTIKLYSAEDAE